MCMRRLGRSYRAKEEGISRPVGGGPRNDDSYLLVSS
jgi:hypothetical protein